MVKKILQITLLLSTVLMADVSMKSFKNIKDVAVEFSQKDSILVKSEIEKIEKKIKGSGKSNIEIVINTKKNKIEHVIVYSKYGEIEFKKSFHEFYKNLYNIRFKKLSTIESMVKIRLEIEKQTTPKINLSIFKDGMLDPYKMYISYLQKEKGYSKKDIRNLLDSDKRTVSKVLLLAIYYDYNKNDLTSAKLNYDLIIDKKIDRFIKSEEGVFLADYLTRDGGHDELILKMFPRYTCDFFKKDFKNQCKYYRARALYNIGDKSYLIPLNQIKDLLVPANRLYQKIKKEGGII